jgi:ribonuclease P protein component
MIARRFRLSRSTWFRKTLDTQPLFRHKGCVVYGLPRHAQAPQTAVLSTQPPPRTPCFFGVIASKKVDKRAVIRNRFRRWVYEAIRLDWLEHPTLHQRYAALVVIVRGGMAELDFETFRQGFGGHMTRTLGQATRVVRH